MFRKREKWKLARPNFALKSFAVISWNNTALEAGQDKNSTGRKIKAKSTYLHELEWNVFFFLSSSFSLFIIWCGWFFPFPCVIGTKNIILQRAAGICVRNNSVFEDIYIFKNNVSTLFVCLFIYPLCNIVSQNC